MEWAENGICNGFATDLHGTTYPLQDRRGQSHLWLDRQAIFHEESSSILRIPVGGS